MLKLKSKFLLLHILNHLLAICGLTWAILNSQFVWLAISFFSFLYVGIFGVNIGLHRYFAHRSFKTNRLGHWVLLISSFLPMLGSPMAWGSVHRLHHQTSDTIQDPHSPNQQGAIKSWFTFWPDIEIPLSACRDFLTKAEIVFLNKHYFTLAGIYALALFLLDWRLAVFVYAIPAVGCFHGASAIAVIPHKPLLGNYRSHETTDQSYNSMISWVLSLGEGWHNNHHYRPQNYRHGETWWEIDPSAFIIKHFFELTDK